MPEIGRTYLGTVTRLAEFGAFVEIIPGTDGLLHISEVAEHRIKDIKDELKEGDQVLVKVLSVEGNRIKLSRKAILKEQRAKLEGSGEAVPVAEAAPARARSLEGAAVTFEGGFDGTETTTTGGPELQSGRHPNEAPGHEPSLPARAPVRGGRSAPQAPSRSSWSAPPSSVV